ncbi:MAG: hypothetical protein HFE78_01480 [Clostridiales bacterium]|nr:hypothetical protein [Clostridiales bacterium]
MKKQLISTIIALGMFVTIVTSAQAIERLQSNRHDFEMQETAPAVSITNFEGKADDAMLADAEKSVATKPSTTEEDEWIAQNKVTIDSVSEFKTDVLNCKIALEGGR